jgi:hypothetical protein
MVARVRACVAAVRPRAGCSVRRWLDARAAMGMTAWEAASWCRAAATQGGDDVRCKERTWEPRGASDSSVRRASGATQGGVLEASTAGSWRSD